MYPVKSVRKVQDTASLHLGTQPDRPDKRFPSTRALAVKGKCCDFVLVVLIVDRLLAKTPAGRHDTPAGAIDTLQASILRPMSKYMLEFIKIQAKILSILTL